MPAAALLEMPFSLPPLGIAKFIFYLFSSCCTFLVLHLPYRLLPAERDKSIWLAIVTFLILVKHFLREILKGQINVVIAVLLLLMLQCLLAARGRHSTGRKAGAGVLWSAAFILKPHALIFLPYFALTRRWTTLISGLVLPGLAVAGLLPFYGFEGTIRQHEMWVSALFDSTPAQLTNVANTSLLGFFNKWTGDGELSLVLFAASAVALAALVLLLIWRGREVDRPLVLEGAVLLILMPLLSLWAGTTRFSPRCSASCCSSSTARSSRPAGASSWLSICARSA